MTDDRSWRGEWCSTRPHPLSSSAAAGCIQHSERFINERPADSSSVTVSGKCAPEGRRVVSISLSVVLSTMSSFSICKLPHGTRTNRFLSPRMTSTHRICLLTESITTLQILPHIVPLRVFTTHGSLFISHLPI